MLRSLVGDAPRILDACARPAREDPGLLVGFAPSADALLAKLRAAYHGGESPALHLTRYFCNRGLEQPTAAMRQLLLAAPLAAHERGQRRTDAID
jgi:hypothetical protein